MESLLIYVLQVNLFLAIVYIGYALLLKNLTFYRMNRVYFISGILFAFGYPFLDLQAIFSKQVEPVGEMIYLLPAWIEQTQQSVNRFTLIHLAMLLLFLGMLFFLAKLVAQLFSLLRIHMRSKRAIWRSFWYRNVVFPIAPFSFFNTIYLHKVQHQEHELADIFKHEDIHVKGHHTFDILFVEFAFILCWYNPAVWLIRKALRQNLEFLTDQQVLDKGADRQLYQYSLLNVSKQDRYTTVANQFNFNILKKRIMMMNKKRSSKLELGKYVFLIPIFVFVAGAFTVSKAERKIEAAVHRAEQISLDGMLPGKTIDENNSADTIVVVGEQDLAVSFRNLDTEKDPLVIIDGHLEIIGKHALRDLNNEDIESIEITKDSTAVQRFGPKAIDGVIEVTTKSKERLMKMRETKGWKYVMLQRKSEIDQKRDFLYIYNGKVISKEEFFQLNDSVLHNMVQVVGDKRDLEAELLKRYPENLYYLDKEGWVEAYSKKGKHAVVQITQEKNVAQEKGKNSETAKSEDLKGIDSSMLNFMYREGILPKANGEKGDYLIKPLGRSVLITSKADTVDQPMFLLNGKRIDSDEMRKLNPNDIESVEVLKNESAIKSYGEEGKKGVVKIMLKKGVHSSNSLPPVTIVGYKGKDGETAPEIDVQPEPRGGMAAFRKWISDHYQYPQAAIDAGVKGTVIVSFIVEKDGALSEIKATQDIGHGTGEASVALLKKSTKWLPGIIDKEPVRAQYSLPIRLDLSQ